MLRPTRRRTAAAISTVVLALLTSALATAHGAAATTLPTVDGSREAPPRPTPAASADTDFSGTVALSNCSGAIVRWASSLPGDKALLLTNGHCYDFLGSREVVVDQPSVRSVTLLNPDGTTAGTVNTTRLLYSTMWTTDVSLYQLGLTYQQLDDQYGVPAITVSDHKPSPTDQPISIISGYWLTEYDCNLNGFAYQLREYVWTWHKSLRYSDGGCQVIGGTSGSPVLDENRVAIGINNTINEDGERCTLNNPCEVNRKGTITVHPQRGYGQQIWPFYTCLSDNQLNLDKAGCKLPKP